VLVEDRAGRADVEAALEVGVIAPPHQRRALAQALGGVERAGVAVDHAA
jgi:hypothetical protein